MTEDTKGSPSIQAAIWYLCAICRHCGANVQVTEVGPHAPASRDPSVPFRGVSCPSCNEKDDYPLDWLLGRLQVNLWTRSMERAKREE